MATSKNSSSSRVRKKTTSAKPSASLASKGARKGATKTNRSSERRTAARRVSTRRKAVTDEAALPEPRIEVTENGGNGAATEPVEAAIRIVNLTKSFGPQVIFEDVSFEIPKGAISIILGPSGTGKSVFLKHLVGLLRPDAGEVWIGDQNVPALPEKELYAVRQKFGVLFQDGALFGSMNIYDNCAFPLREHTKKPESEIRQIVREKLELVGLQGAEKKLPGEISGGMKKRAGLARALVLGPEIILFDEPDSGLDPVRTAFLCNLIVDLKKELGSTMIVVTHHIPSAEQIADYIGLLFRRHLVTFGPKADMFKSIHPVVKQFLSGATEGPIGMSEEKDQPGDDVRPSQTPDESSKSNEKSAVAG